MTQVSKMHYEHIGVQLIFLNSVALGICNFFIK